MKVNIELNFTENGIFLNAWDNENGNDICARCHGSDMFDIDGDSCTFNDFIDRVEKREKEKHG